MTYDPNYEPPPSIEEMMHDIIEYQVANMSWGDIRGVLEHYFIEELKRIPPEALQSRYDAIFNR